MGLVTVLYVFVKVSLFLPQWVEVRAFSILIVFSALSFEVLICSLNVSLGSKVSPSILGLRIVGSRVLSSCSDSSSLYSAGSGVKSVVIVNSKSVPASTRLEDPSRKGTTRTAKSAPFNPCPSREGPYSTVFSVSRPMDPLMWLAGLLALSGDVETNVMCHHQHCLLVHST